MGFALDVATIPMRPRFREARSRSSRDFWPLTVAFAHLCPEVIAVISKVIDLQRGLVLRLPPFFRLCRPVEKMLAPIETASACSFPWKIKMHGSQKND